MRRLNILTRMSLTRGRKTSFDTVILEGRVMRTSSRGLKKEELYYHSALFFFFFFSHFKNRVEPVIMEIERSRRPLLIICHRAVLRCLYAYLTNTDKEKMPM